MKSTFIKRAALLFFTSLLLSTVQPAVAQSGASAVLDSATLDAQLDFIHENTRVYNEYRAIRDDIFLRMIRNMKDTLNAARLEIEELNSMVAKSAFEIETLNTDLTRTKNEKDEAIRNRDSLAFLGIRMSKGLYNTILWFIILGLAAMATLMVLFYRRSHKVTKDVQDELKTTLNDFEEYRKGAREKYEKLVVSHHNEIMKLKNT